MALAVVITAIVIVGGATLYVAVRSREVRKFLAGAFFVSAGIQFYLCLAGVPVPLLGTSFVQTPQLSCVRALVHFIIFLITFFFGFVRTPGGRRRER